MERIVKSVLNKSIRFTSIPTASAIPIKSSYCNNNERDNNKFNVNEGRNTNNTYQYARSYTSTKSACDLWPVYQRSTNQFSVLGKYFQHQHLFVRHLCTVKVKQKKMVSKTSLLTRSLQIFFPVDLE